MRGTDGVRVTEHKQRGHLNRGGVYFYNTTEEIDRMIEILRAAVRFFS